MSANNVRILLTDTNAAYKLYFFARKGLLPEQNIIINKMGIIEFHPIVLDEIEGHVGFWKKAVEFGITDRTKHAPKFFQGLLDDDFPKLLSFIKNNMCAQVGTVDIKGDDFAQRRRIYDTERIRLQKKWQSSGVKGRKTESKPSENDYALLFSAEKFTLKIVTHDEILAAVATELLEEDVVYRVEDIIANLYQQDNNLKVSIEAVLGNLDFLGESLITTRIFI